MHEKLYRPYLSMKCSYWLRISICYVVLTPLFTQDLCHNDLLRYADACHHFIKYCRKTCIHTFSEFLEQLLLEPSIENSKLHELLLLWRYFIFHFCNFLKQTFVPFVMTDITRWQAVCCFFLFGKFPEEMLVVVCMSCFLFLGKTWATKHWSNIFIYTWSINC